ncbi:MAG: hypothetical protein JKY37_09115 [Nannocystaceae bacterium]|nr:hypothetical protein [Nannocystaceae bacterium]
MFVTWPVEASAVVRTANRGGLLATGVVGLWLAAACGPDKVAEPPPVPGTCEPSTPIPWYEEDRCGDEVVDIYDNAFSEECDGTNVPQTCVALGYPGGTIGCTEHCQFDASKCTVCSADPRGRDCGLLPIEPLPGARPLVAIGPNGIGVAYYSAAAKGVHFVLLNEDLSPISPTVCLDYDGSPTSLAATEDGWWMTVHGEGEVLAGQLMRLTNTGEVRFVRDFGLHYSARLNSSAGFALLTYTSAEPPVDAAARRSPILAERLDEDGSARWQVELPVSGLGFAESESVSVDGGYLVATPGTFVTFMHLSSDGMIEMADDFLAEAIDARLLQHGGPAALFTTVEDYPLVRFVSLDALGRPTSDPVPLPDTRIPSAPVVRSGFLLDVSAQVDPLDQLHARWINLTTGAAAEPWRIAQLPNERGASSYHFNIITLDLPDPAVLWSRGDLAGGVMSVRLVDTP